MKSMRVLCNGIGRFLAAARNDRALQGHRGERSGAEALSKAKGRRNDKSPVERKKLSMAKGKGTHNSKAGLFGPALFYFNDFASLSVNSSDSAAGLVL
jgi:hypothetical protein